MSKILQEVLAANQKYAANFGEKAKLAMPPARHLAVLTCMDARLDPAKFAGLAEGTRTSFVTPADVRVTTPFVRSSFPTSCWERGSGSSFTTPIAAWNSSPTR